MKRWGLLLVILLVSVAVFGSRLAQLSRPSLGKVDTDLTVVAQSRQGFLKPLLTRVARKKPKRSPVEIATTVHEDGSKTLTSRDFRKRTLEQRLYSSDGVLLLKRQFVMDRNGKVKSGVSFDGGDHLTSTFRYKFDDLGRIHEENIYDRSGNVVRAFETTYDEQGLSKRIASERGNDDAWDSLNERWFDHPDLLEVSGKTVEGDPFKFPPESPLDERPRNAFTSVMRGLKLIK